MEILENNKTVLVKGNVIGFEKSTLEPSKYLVQFPDLTTASLSADMIEDEPQKPVVKKFVADWYEKHKNSLEFNIFDYVYRFDQNEESDLKDWFNDINTNPFQTLVNMHQFGYTVEKEKRYLVKIKSTGQCLGKYYINNEILSPRFIYTGRNADGFTSKKLEEAGFGEVFNCPLFEVEEVE